MPCLIAVLSDVLNVILELEEELFPITRLGVTMNSVAVTFLPNTFPAYVAKFKLANDIPVRPDPSPNIFHCTTRLGKITLPVSANVLA